MAKNNGNTVSNNDTDSAAVMAPAPNFVLTYRTEHPKNRCSYGVAGVSGIVVFDRNLFATDTPPATITLDFELKQPQVKSSTAKAEAAAARLAEKAAKAQERLDKAAAKLAEKQAKAQEAADKAQAKLDAATASSASATE